MMPADYSWLIGGQQGSGVESGANIFSKTCARLGYHVFGKREFYSNIKGEHSYFVVRVSDEPISSNVTGVDLMTCFDAETVFRHYDDVREAIIYDSGMEGTTHGQVATIDPQFRGRLSAELESHGADGTVASALEVARRRGVKLIPVPFRDLLARLAEQTGNERLKGMVRMFNVLGVALAAGYLGMPWPQMSGAVSDTFAKKPAVARLNLEAAEYAYNYAAASFASPRITGAQKRPGTMLVLGHEGTSLGKMVAGCRFQSYYPITPASDESMYLESHERISLEGGGSGSTVVVQVEDEISAIGMMIGASLTGSRSSTSTSGPGFALMTEALGWAGINEVPMVLTLYQRSGPSTGLPTRHGQDDLAFAVNSGHGDFPKIVYASGDIEESFYDTGRCFNYADVFQIPVIHMMDKFLASSVATCPRFDPSRVSIDRGKLLESAQEGYRRFEFTDDGVSPRSRLGLKGGVFWNTGDESDEEGHITEDPVLRVKMMDKRMSRLDMVLDRVPQEEQAVKHFGGKTLVVSWGSTKGPLLDALKALRADGLDVGFVQVKLIHPFPAELVSSMVEGAETIVNVEANYAAQFGAIFRQHTGRSPDCNILKYTGRAMTSTELYDALKRAADGAAGKREVLTYGA